MATGLRQAPKRQGLNMHRVGTSGTDNFSGYIRDEYQVDLQSTTQRAEVYDRMRRSDATVATLLRVLELPLKRATYTVEPASQEPVDLEAAEFAKHCLFEALRDSWSQVLSDVLTFLQYGFALLEPVHKVEDWTYTVEGEDGETEETDRPDMVKWARFAFLGQRTVQRWFVNGDDELLGVEQAGYYQRDDGTSQYRSSQRIDAANLVAFAHDQRGTNFEGISLLRPAYRNWKALDLLTKIEMIGLQRMAVGTPMMQAPESPTPEDVDAAKEMMRSYVVHEEAGIYIPAGWTVSIVEGKMDSEALQKAIIQHKGQILSLAMAQFLQHGIDGQSGNRALAGSQIDLFTELLWAIGEYVASVFTGSLGRLLDLNYTLKRKPVLKLVQIVDKDVAASLEGIKVALEAQMVKPYDALEDHVIAMLDLPERPKDEQVGPEGPEIGTVEEVQDEAEGAGQAAPGATVEETVEAKKVEAKNEKQGLSDSRDGAHQLADHGDQADPWRPWRALRPREERLGGLQHFSATSKALDEAEASFLRDAGRVTEKQRSAVVKAIQGAVGDEDLAALTAIDVPLMDEYRTVLARHLEVVAADGWSQVAKELGKPSGDGADLGSWAAARAAVLAEKHATDLKAQVVGGVLDALAEQRLKDSTVQDLVVSFSNRIVAADFARVLEAASGAMPASLGA